MHWSISRQKQQQKHLAYYKIRKLTVIMDKAITCLKPSDGGLHLGHWIGNIQPLINNQNNYECIFVFADLQASNVSNKSCLKENVTLMLKQMLALGVDPTRVRFYMESQLKRDKIDEFILLSNYVTNSRINRMPVFKRRTAPVKMSMYLFPVLQMLDFYLTGATVAFSNVDNKAAIELTNETFRKINAEHNFHLPHITLEHGTVEMLVGFDNEKMSKAKNNCIYFTDSFEMIKKKINKMYTDPTRIHPNMPGNITNNVVFKYFQAFLDESEYAAYVSQYEQGILSDSVAKEILNERLWRLIGNCQENLNKTNHKNVLDSLDV